MPAEVREGQWSAFVAPDLAPVFVEATWLDIPPGAEGQADLLKSLKSITPQAWESALAILAPRGPQDGARPDGRSDRASTGEATPEAPRVTSAPAVQSAIPTNFTDPRAFLIGRVAQAFGQNPWEVAHWPWADVLGADLMLDELERIEGLRARERMIEQALLIRFAVHEPSKLEAATRELDRECRGLPAQMTGEEVHQKVSGIEDMAGFVRRVERRKQRAQRIDGTGSP